MLSEREAKGEIRGIEIGEFRMLVKQVKKGRLTIEEAAEDAAMSVEEFQCLKTFRCFIIYWIIIQCFYMSILTIYFCHTIMISGNYKQIFVYI